MRLAFISLLLSLGLEASMEQGQVCLIIDTHGANSGGYPVRARIEGESLQYFQVFNGYYACFELNKVYAMEIFLRGTQGSGAYVSQCTYSPNAKDDGKVLYYRSQGQSTDCYIENAFTIEQTQELIEH